MFRSLIIIFCLSACGIKSRGPEGAFEGTDNFKPFGVRNADSVHLVKIFMHGYWIAAIYGNSYQSMYNCAGGKYWTNNGSLFSRVDFSSGDTSVIEQVNEFEYSMLRGKLQESEYKGKSPVLADLYRKTYILIKPPATNKDDFLEGVWMITENQVSYTRNGDQYLKIYSYPRYAWVHYNLSQKRLIAAGGGTYDISGDTLRERVDYSTYKMAVGTLIEKKIKKYSRNKIMCYDVDSFYDEEIWNRKND